MVQRRHPRVRHGLQGLFQNKLPFGSKGGSYGGLKCVPKSIPSMLPRELHRKKECSKESPKGCSPGCLKSAPKGATKEAEETDYQHDRGVWQSSKLRLETDGKTFTSVSIKTLFTET